MVSLTRKEAFECSLAQLLAVAEVVNNGGEKLFDYSIIHKSKSVSPLKCLQPLDYFQWNDNPIGEELSYIFAPITEPYNDLIIGMFGRQYFEENGKFEIVKANTHPTPWIREVLVKKYLKLSYDISGILSFYELSQDTSFISKTHSDWIKYHNKTDEEIIYIPYYNLSQRQKIFNSFPQQTINDIRQEYWNE